MGGDAAGVADGGAVPISIHAPRVGGDYHDPGEEGDGDISIHAPRVGGDRKRVDYLYEVCRFQSTPPVWGATAKTAKNSICSREK